MRPLVLIPLALLSAHAAAAPPRDAVAAKLAAISAPVSQAELRKRVSTLVSFGTRHTLSSQTDPKRGIGAALRWSEEEFRRYSAAASRSAARSR